MAKLQELSLFEVIGERKNKYEFSFVTTFNAYLPFYEQIVLRHLRKAGCRVNTVLMDAGHFAAAITDTNAKPNVAGRDYTIIPVSPTSGVFHPKILLLIGAEHAVLCIGSHNLTLSGFGKNRELTTIFEVNSNSEDEERQIFREVWKAIRHWTKNQPEEMLDSLTFVEKEIEWLLPTDNIPSNQASNFFYVANESGISLWDQIKPIFPQAVRRVTLVSPFFDEDLAFLQKIKTVLNPQEFVVGIEPTTVQLVPEAQDIFPSIKFVDPITLRENSGYLHAKSIYVESEAGENILITGSANASRAAWLSNGRNNCEAVTVYRSKEAISAAKAIGIDNLHNCPAIEAKDWQTIEINKIKHDQAIIEKDNPILCSAIETDFGFRIVSNDLSSDLDWIAECIDAAGEIIFTSELTENAQQEKIISVENDQIRLATNMVKLISDEETVLAFVHHTQAIVAKFYKTQYQEFFTALESFDIPVDNRFWRLFERIVFVDGDALPEYLDARLSSMNEAQNLISKDSESEPETLQETFSVKTANLDFKERLYRNSLDGIGKFLSFLNQRLYVPRELFPTDIGKTPEIESEIEAEDAETEEVFDPDFDNEQIAATYHQRTRTMMRRISKKLVSSKDIDERSVLALVRQFAVVLGVLHWVRQLEKTERFSKCKTQMLSIEDEWKLFVDATAFISTFENSILGNADFEKRNFLEEWSMVIGHLLWLSYDCWFDINKLDELRRQNYGEDRDDCWTTDEVLNGVACFLKLAVYLSKFESAQQTFEKLIEDEDSADWEKRNIGWLHRMGEAAKDLSSLTTSKKKAHPGNLIVKNNEIFVVKDCPGNVELVVLAAKNHRRKYSAAVTRVIDL